MAVFGFRSRCLVVVLASACATAPPDQPDESSGNAALGIAQFTVDDAADQTTITGLDSDGAEVGHLTIVHGRFALSELYADDYPGVSEVDGRKLDVEILDQKMRWETAGYDPVLHLPAPPRANWAIAAFINDPHVKPLIDRWQIGFEYSGTEAAYGQSLAYGFFPMECTGYPTCGSTNRGTIGTCGGLAVPDSAWKVSQYMCSGASFDQDLVYQCCPPNASFSDEWFAQKSCPRDSPDGNGSCGVVTTGACKGCPAYVAPVLCDVDMFPYQSGECEGDKYQMVGRRS